MKHLDISIRGQNACVKLRFNNKVINLITQKLKTKQKIKNKNVVQCSNIGNAHYNTFNIMVRHIEIHLTRSLCFHHC